MKIPIESIYNQEGDLIKAGGDNVIFYEGIERAKKIYVEKDILMYYNDINPLNDFKINSEEQRKNSTYVQNI